uniref:Glutaminyl-peptide cyclotransferase n=1 Tax=Lepeophtheirus salmonis TaxID=72036 RepID=A0A0K2SVW6_LEPSM
MKKIRMFMILILLFTLVFGDSWKGRKHSHFDKLSSSEAFSLSNAEFYANKLQDEDNFRMLLNKVLILRTVGSPGHAKVRSDIVTFMRGLGWYVEEQEFDGKTPLGEKSFTNIIATHDPTAPRQLLLACHYDSKLTPKGFLGAIDSAVPCAQMMNVAHTLRNVLQNRKAKDISLQLVFFDGEEAFVNWNKKDSIYGARHMAQNWTEQKVVFGNEVGRTLDRIDLFVLLDLLGTKAPKIYNYFEKTENWFALMQYVEETLASKGLLQTKDRIFHGKQGNFGIEDDHIPFLQRGVPILHLIPVPFPSVWHTIQDNYDALDFPTIKDLNKILRVFVASYLDLT